MPAPPAPTLNSMADLMDEAAKNLRELLAKHPVIADQLQVRFFAPDELEGSAIMLRDEANLQQERQATPAPAPVKTNMFGHLEKPTEQPQPYRDHAPLSDEDLDHSPFTFGKYKGRFTPSQIAESDPQYIVWAYDNVTNRRVCSKALRDACEEDARESQVDQRSYQPPRDVRYPPGTPMARSTGFGVWDDDDDIPF